MNIPTETTDERPEALRQAYAALNRNDIHGFVRLFAPDIERIEPAHFGGEGTYRGIEAVIAHISHHRANWAEGGCEPERIAVSGDRVLIFVHVRVRLKGESDWREGHTADGFAFRDGHVVQFRTFTDIGEALSWAGLPDHAPRQP